MRSAKKLENKISRYRYFFDCIRRRSEHYSRTDSGGDDYVTKPFKLGELCSRIRALLRRAGVSNVEKSVSIECGDITIDLLGNRVSMKDRILDLTSAEYRLLCLLVRNANRVITRDIILNELWDEHGNFVDDNTLSVYVRRLQRKSRSQTHLHPVTFE